ncbi:EAL domain-containing protein [Erythrobacter sp. YJ-T3-07]|uniref:sensor domain-containing phosphodiesterase n=1 Tax=Erythrobacter sp. YJ-T3-07 TaxID=2793063 RepID=UPI0018D39F60|nr:EAL domain-containing protein [Erythrobacter sp. YJ-T3-07]MBH1944293.1 EAL domain-containing protein [Erythrobacter sp. YJ-T3-07]
MVPPDPDQPRDEGQRLHALAELAVLDTPVETEFDDLTALAASSLGMESAAISLIDHDRQWFKSRVNLPFVETPRDIAFCHYTVEQRDLLVVQDATRDPRFCDNPLVTADGGIRFYAGAPLILEDGSCVGSLCIIDPRPRDEFDQKSADLLKGLARLVSRMLIARRNRLRGEIATKVINATSDAIVAADREGKIVLLNGGAEDLFGRPAAEMLGESIEVLMPERYRDGHQSRLERVKALGPTGELRNFAELPVQTADGEELLTDMSLARWGDRGGVGGFAAIFRDIRDRKALETDRNNTRNQLDAIVANLPSLLFVKDLSTRKYVLVNDKACDVMGLPESEIIGRSDRELFGSIGEEFEQRDQKAAQIKRPFRYESTFISKDGRSFDIRTTRIVMDGPDRPGQYVLGVGEDMTDFRRTEAEKTWLARYDDLTGLLNRTSLSELLADYVGEGTPFAMLCVNLDRFKAVNEQFGQSAGDAVLQEIGTRLQILCGAQGTIARVGGDEFIVLLKGDRLEMRTVQLAQKIVSIAAAPVVASGTFCHIGASVGVAFFPEDGGFPQALRDRVELALHRAKKEGGGRICLFDATLDAQVRDRRMLESDLRTAINRGDIVLHYQPVMSARTGMVSSVEALARWEHETRGPISPEMFIALAEDCGLIDDLGRKLIFRACSDMIAMPETMRVAVNLSPQQFKSGELLATVRDALKRTGLAPHRLQLEVTERLVIENTQETFAQLEELRSLGIQILMDDFGVGHSSLSYFQMFPFDKVKIDKSFIADIETSKTARAIVEAVIGLGRQLSMGIVAEGVECQEQNAVLSELGCTHLQGYFFSRPMPLEEIAQFVAKNAHAVPLPVAPPRSARGFSGEMRSAGSTTG